MPKKCLLPLLIIAWSFLPPAAASAEEFTATVVDTAGEPVPDATVRVYEARARRARLFHETVTDDAGVFTAERPETLEPMTLLWVTVSKDGFALCWFTLIGDRQPAAVIVLERPVVTSGAVLSEAGQPVAGAEVRAMLLGGEGFGRQMIVGRRGVREAVTYSDAGGRFSFDLPPRSFADFMVSAPGFARVCTCVSNVARPHYSAGESVKIVMRPESTAGGRVIEKRTGRRVAGVRVVAAPADGRRRAFGPLEAVSDIDGAFTIHGLCAGDWVVSLPEPRAETAEWAARPVTVSVEDGAAAEGLEFVLEKGGIIEAQALDASTGRPAPRVAVIIEGADSRYQVLADSDGVARVRVLPGTYTVSNGWGMGYVWSYGDETVTVEEGAVAKAHIALEPYRRATGVVRDASGKPVAGVIMRLLPVDNRRRLWKTDSEGRFEVEWHPQHWNLPEDGRGTTYLYARDPAGNRCALVPCGAEAGLFDPETGPVEITLGPGIAVQGRVVASGGRGIAGARVRCSFRHETRQVRLIARAIAGEDGVFTIPALAGARTYELSVAAPGYTTWNHRLDLPEAGKRTFDLSETILARAEETISGTVIDGEGRAVHDAIISASIKGQPKRYAFSNKSGEFTIKGLSAGEAAISANYNGERSTGLKAQPSASGLRITVGKSTPPPDLAGRMAPEFADLLPHDFPFGQFEGKPVVVCFFDANQRPSRHVLSQLSAKAEALAEKGVAVVAVDASGAALADVKGTLGATVDIPLGSAGEKPAETMIEWGVKGLPWLILTDRDHVVRAEGFGVDELEAELAQLAGK